MENEDKLRTAVYARDQLGGITHKTFWEWNRKGLIKVVRINDRNYVLDSEIDRLKQRGDAA